MIWLSRRTCLASWPEEEPEGTEPSTFRPRPSRQSHSCVRDYRKSAAVETGPFSKGKRCPTTLSELSEPNRNGHLRAVSSNGSIRTSRYRQITRCFQLWEWPDWGSSEDTHARQDSTPLRLPTPHFPAHVRVERADLSPAFP